MKKELEKTYDPKLVEGKIYKLWEESGYFDPDNLKLETRNQKAFTIIMPPPNANGALHIGHALFVTLQDIMVRFERMRGKKVLWLPGADHAGFETQVVYNKKLEKEGRSVFTEPREKIRQEIWDFTQANKRHMENQLRKLGASCDWSREKFTLDPDVIRIVYETFYKLYEDSLLYRDIRVVNWCPKHQTALSDLEVKYTEREDPLYYIKYGPLILATVRPETKFGDTALAVNPKDARYKKYIGKEIEATGLLGQLKFKVIADQAVDPGFGTGVVKVTPAHDATDFEIWSRHKNEIPGPKQIIDERGRLTAETGPYAGLKVSEARAKIAEDMKKVGILLKVDPNYKHQVAVCYKCENILEPLPKKQWFIRMSAKPKSGGLSLRDAAVKAVKAGKIKFVTKKFEKIFFHWMKNIRDWNISRQIVWGIRIPAWYHAPLCIPKPGREADIKNCKEIIISETEPKCEFCDAKYSQDTDVFDTWFSSGQWPFAVLLAQSSSNAKLKNQNEKFRSDFEEFYPTDVMETGYDILFFWVARMIMLGIYVTGKVPFKTVYLHGLVRDKDKQKMSKSKGNVVDPLGVAEVYGADAVRMALVSGTAPGNDPVIAEEKIRGYRNFSTKIWNIARFILMQSDMQHVTSDKEKIHFTPADKKYIKEFQTVKKSVTKYLETYQFHLAAGKIYHYIWHTFADKIVEEAKPRLKAGDADSAAALAVLKEIFTGCLKLLHPFMPFITEALYEYFAPGLSESRKLIMIEEW